MSLSVVGHWCNANAVILYSPKLRSYCHGKQVFTLSLHQSHLCISLLYQLYISSNMIIGCGTSHGLLWYLI